jgi:hypothetical protein
MLFFVTYMCDNYPCIREFQVEIGLICCICKRTKLWHAKNEKMSDENDMPSSHQLKF